MSTKESDDNYEAFEPLWAFLPDPLRHAWQEQLAALSSAEVLIREGTRTPRDGRRVRDLQVACSPITPQTLRENVSMIAKERVLLAEIDDVHVGLCVSLPGPAGSDPLFVKVVGVVEEARRRGVGLALLTAAAERVPRRDIALATQDDNDSARALIERFAGSIGASAQRVNLDTYKPRDLGIKRGIGYRAWVVRRPPAAAPTSA